MTIHHIYIYHTTPLYNTTSHLYTISYTSIYHTSIQYHIPLYTTPHLYIISRHISIYTSTHPDPWLTTDLPPFTASITSHTCLLEAGSSPVVGSSRMRISGLLMHAMATERRFLILRERFLDLRLRASYRLTCREKKRSWKTGKSSHDIYSGTRTPEMWPPLTFKSPKACFWIHSLKCGHPSNKDTFTGPKGGRFRGVYVQLQVLSQFLSHMSWAQSDHMNSLA